MMGICADRLEELAVIVADCKVSDDSVCRERLRAGRFLDTECIDGTLCALADLFHQGRCTLHPVNLVLAAGADPFFDRSYAHVMIACAAEDIAGINLIFSMCASMERAQATNAMTQAGLWDKLSRYREVVDDIGTTGWMLEVKMGVIGSALNIAAAMDKGIFPSIEDITRQNDRGQSVLTLCIDRGSIDKLLAPEYWHGRENELKAAIKNMNLSSRRLKDPALGKFLDTNFSRLSIPKSTARYRL